MTHVWNFGSIVLERNASGAVVNRFHRGLGHLISSDHHGYYLFNVRGDVVQRVDSAGNVIHTYRYDAFGNEQNQDEVNTNPFRFAGEYFCFSSGMIYLRARFYNPTTGRFTQEDPFWTIHNMQFGINPATRNGRQVPDPLAIMQAGNLFVFCLNNPIRFIDPSGLNVIDLGRGWFARIERGVDPNTQRHVHVYSNRQHWAQNEDGSPHDRGGNSPGNPPNRVLDRLKERAGWDWRAKQNMWINDIIIGPLISHELGTTREITFPDGVTAIWCATGGNSLGLIFSFNPSNAQLVNLFLNTQATQGSIPMTIPITAPVGVPKPVPAAPVPVQIPIFIRIF